MQEAPGHVRALSASACDVPPLSGANDAAGYDNAVENYVGTVQVPVGLTPALHIRGRFAAGRYAVPLATTEAALVASYSRGIATINEAGGCVAALLEEAIGRTPALLFRSLTQACAFAAWVEGERAEIRRIAEATTRHGRLVDVRSTIEGNHVYLDLRFTTGEAAGQNIVTFATEAVLAHLLERAPERPLRCYVEGNLSGDKKASARAFGSVRGKRVTAEVVLPAALVERRLHASVAELAELWRVSALGGVLSGAIGTQGQFANGLAALYIACGQDAACVAESAVGVTRMEATAEGALYASVTLPNLVVGTVGGGTGLPSQRGFLELMRLPAANGARALAEIAGGLCLAGELSLAAAVAAGEFAAAHKRFARNGRAR